MKITNVPAWSIVTTGIIVGISLYVVAVLMLPVITESEKTWDRQRLEIQKKNDEYVREHGGYDRLRGEWVPPAVKLAGY